MEDPKLDVSLTGNFDEVLNGAIRAFYAHLARAYPEITKSHVDPNARLRFREHAQDALVAWLGNNGHRLHTNDEDCQRYIVDGCCAWCNVDHGEPCDHCKQRAFHRANCPEMEF